jgi:hypothetical protein
LRTLPSHFLPDFSIIYFSTQLRARIPRYDYDLQLRLTIYPLAIMFMMTPPMTTPVCAPINIIAHCYYLDFLVVDVRVRVCECVNLVPVLRERSRTIKKTRRKERKRGNYPHGVWPIPNRTASR